MIGQKTIININENCVMDNVKPLTKGKIILGRARTLRYLPERPDLKVFLNT